MTADRRPAAAEIRDVRLLQFKKTTKLLGNLSVRETVVYIFSWRVARRSLLIALIVGCVLSVANQYDVLARGPITSRLWIKLFFNFLVPLVVSSTSAAVNRPRLGAPH